MKKKTILAIKYLWILAVVVFVVLYFYTHFDTIVKIVYTIPVFNLLVAFCALLVAKILLSYITFLSLRYVGEYISFYKIFLIYNITQLAKYIPGSIWQFVGKAGAYSNEGMEVGAIKKSIFIEILWVLFSAFTVGIILVLSGDLLEIESIIINTQQYALFFGIGILITFIIAGFYYKKTLSFLYLFIDNIFLDIKIFFVLLFIWFLLGMSFYITLEPYVENVSIVLYIDIVGLYALAYAIGFLVPFAPAGIGIREAILIGGLATILSAEQAIVLASLNRIIYIIVEVVIVMLIIPCKFINDRKRDNPSKKMG